MLAIGDSVRFRGGLKVVGIVGLYMACLSPVRATDPASMSYWVSTRSVSSEAQPGFVPLSYLAQGDYQSPVTGCRNRIFYLRAADAAAVQVARNAGEIVQIHRGEPGTSPQSSIVICLIQAGQ